MLSNVFKEINSTQACKLPTILLFRPEHQSGAIVFTQMKNVLTKAKRPSFFIVQPAQLETSDNRLRKIAKQHAALTAKANLIAAMPYIQPSPLCEKQERLHMPFNLYGIYSGSIADLFGLNLIPTYEYKGVTYPKPFAMMLDTHAHVLAMMELHEGEDDVEMLMSMALSLEMNERIEMSA